MTGFATGAASPVDLLVSADGALLYLTRGSGGSVFRVDPTTQVTVATSPPGLPVLLDGQPRATPAAVTSIVGVQHTLEAPALQRWRGRPYRFVGWSDGGARIHTIFTPGSSTTFTATYVRVTHP